MDLSGGRSPVPPAYLWIRARRSGFRPWSFTTHDTNVCIIGYSSAPSKTGQVREDEEDLHEDADRTLLSTPPRDIHAHTLSPSVRSKSETVDFAARDCPEIDLRAVSRSRQGSTRPRRELVSLRTQVEVDELHDERTLVHRYVCIPFVWIRKPEPHLSSNHGHEDHVKDAFRLLANSSGAISVSDALEALQHISTENAAQFTPGTTHLGKEFLCWYA